MPNAIDTLRDDRQWIEDWRAGMFSSTSRDAEGWPIEMHGVVLAWEQRMDQLESLLQAAEAMCRTGTLAALVANADALEAAVRDVKGDT